MFSRPPIFLFVLFLLAGCAGLKLSEGSAETLHQRAQEFWDARVAGDLVTCYKYELNAKLKKMSLTDYIKSKGNLIYKTAKVLSVSLKDDSVAEVKVSLEYALPAFGTSRIMKSIITEKWSKVDGVWYRQEEDKLKKSE